MREEVITEENTRKELEESLLLSVFNKLFLQRTVVKSKTNNNPKQNSGDGEDGADQLS